MKLSIVTTLYYSSPYLNKFYNRIKKASEKITNDYEIIFVNDGSPDDSLEKVIKFYEKNNKIKIIDLSRNFGHHKAIMTGLKYAEGEYVFLIDCDLEEDPELLLKFWDEIKKKDEIDVVYGVQGKRKGKFFERISGSIYFFVFNLLSKNKIPKNFLTIRLMSNRYVKSLISYTEYHTVFSGIVTLTGYNKLEIIIEKKDKKFSSYTLIKKISLLINSITSFSDRPLIYISYLGVLILLGATIFILKILYQKLFYGVEAGWSSVMVSIWFFGGLIIFINGIIGIYIAKIFEQTKNRPYVIIKKIYRKNK